MTRVHNPRLLVLKHLRETNSVLRNLVSAWNQSRTDQGATVDGVWLWMAKRRKADSEMPENRADDWDTLANTAELECRKLAALSSYARSRAAEVRNGTVWK
jgi:hypothetical protein